MINQFSSYLVNIMKENNVVEEKDLDWYIYGTELFIITIIKYLGLFIIAVLLGWIKEAFIYILAFSILRNQAGGVHSDSFLRCFVVTNLITIASIYLVKYVFINILYIILPLMIILSIIIVYKYAPIDTPNRTLDEVEILKYKKRSRVVVLMGSIIILILTLTINSIILYTTIAAIGFFGEAVTLTPPVARRKI